MTTLYLIRRENGFEAAPESRDDLDKWGIGEEVKAEVTGLTSRSSAMHRKYFVLLRVLHGYLERSMRFETFRHWMTVAAGFFDIAPDGTMIPLSISFSEMPQDEFRQLYNAVIDYAIQQYVPEHVSREDIEGQVENLLWQFG